ncbi:hypothetical protein LWC35_05700 [Pseudonocardia kujensis]|uniref:hypothetical protein n=1 Tax=Pseudonocardia kujensis TaxID=1128675 RepID=UPI001E62F938|nr:hypothetical protein [Pseudonocardia kujensis]MCE0762405.1 hypothetical protein [Pseudonocardia kujensis]
MSALVPPDPTFPTRLDDRHADLGDRLLASLEALVERHRRRSTGDDTADGELVAAEAAHRHLVARIASPRMRS